MRVACGQAAGIAQRLQLLGRFLPGQDAVLVNRVFFDIGIAQLAFKRHVEDMQQDDFGLRGNAPRLLDGA